VPCDEKTKLLEEIKTAMAAQVTTRLWSVHDLVAAWERWEREQPKRAA